MVDAVEPATEVTVLFEDAAVLFALPRDATFEELAARLEGIAECEFGAPVAIDVTLRH